MLSVCQPVSASLALVLPALLQPAWPGCCQQETGKATLKMRISTAAAALCCLRVMRDIPVDPKPSSQATAGREPHLQQSPRNVTKASGGTRRLTVTPSKYNTAADSILVAIVQQPSRNARICWLIRASSGVHCCMRTCIRSGASRVCSYSRKPTFSPTDSESKRAPFWNTMPSCRHSESAHGVLVIQNYSSRSTYA